MNDLVEKEAPEKSNLPAYLQEMQGQVGEDNFDESDLVMPRIKLLQGTSAEVQTHDDAKPGVFWHTGLDINLGSSLRFVIAKRNKKYLLVAPMEDGQNVLAAAADAKLWDRCGEWQVKFKDRKDKVTWSIPESCAVKDDNDKVLGYDVEKSGLLKWGTSKPDDEDSPPAATMFYDYLVLLADRPDLGPAVISLGRSQIKKAKQGINNKLQMIRQQGQPMQCLVFQAVAVDDTNGNNEPFKNWGFRGDGFAPEDLFLQAREYADTIMEFKVKDEGHTDDQDGDKFESDEY